MHTCSKGKLEVAIGVGTNPRNGETENKNIAKKFCSTFLTSLFLYRELIISFIIRLTSAWKANFSAFSLSSFICATFNPSSLIASSSLWTASSSVLEPSLLFPTSSSTVGGSVSVFSSVFSSSAKQRAEQKWTQIILF